MESKMFTVNCTFFTYQPTVSDHHLCVLCRHDCLVFQNSCKIWYMPRQARRAGCPFLGIFFTKLFIPRRYLPLKCHLLDVKYGFILWHPLKIHNDISKKSENKCVQEMQSQKYNVSYCRRHTAIFLFFFFDNVRISVCFKNYYFSTQIILCKCIRSIHFLSIIWQSGWTLSQ